MSFKSSLVKIAIKMTPDMLVQWVANLVLKGVAKLSDFSFDIDSRTVYVRLLLAGEDEPIELSLDGFSFIREGQCCYLIIKESRSNKLWLKNLLGRFVGKPLNIPVPSGHQAQFDLLAEVFKAETPNEEEH